MNTQMHLEEALLNDGDMSAELFEDELMEHLPTFRASMEEDGDDFMFVITERSGDVAMVLLEPENRVHVNADARERLRALWPLAYENNMEMLIPAFADDLDAGEFAMNGVKTAR